MIVYRTRTYGPNEIFEQEVTRTTDGSVFVMVNGKERRESRRTEYTRYFDTREDAIAYLKEMAVQAVGRATSSLKNAVSNLEELGKMYPAEPK